MTWDTKCRLTCQLVHNEAANIVLLICIEEFSIPREYFNEKRRRLRGDRRFGQFAQLMKAEGWNPNEEEHLAVVAAARHRIPLL